MSQRARIQRKREKVTPLPFPDEMVQNNPFALEQGADEMPSIVQEAISSGGRPLDESTRDFMEPRFGHDFSQVRVHTDERAAVSGVLQGQDASIQSQSPSSLVQRQDDFHLTPPSLVGPKQEQHSLFPRGEEPHLHLDLPKPSDLLTFPGLTVNSVGPPRWITAPPSVSKAQNEDEPDSVWELDFDIKTEPTSQEGRRRIDLGLPLESGAEQAQAKAELLHTIISGKDAQDTPLGLQLLNAGVNVGAALLGKTQGGNALMENLFLDKLTFVINPATGTYGATVQFKLP